MTPQTQSWLSLLAVAISVAWLARRTLAARKKPGCGGDCGCPSKEIKAKLRG